MPEESTVLLTRGCQEATKPGRSRWWFEWEVGCLVLLVGVIYFLRLADLPIRGEESRWATVALEMLQGGDWIVPRQQGAVFPDRPPLGSWVIAVVTWFRAGCDLWAIRLPSALATLFTTLLVYAYSRTFLSRLGALAAGAAFATMAHVLQLGRLGESDALLTLFISAALLVWHWGYRQGWPALGIWIAGYTLAGLGALAKGPQGPVYFTSIVGLYLLSRREWRYLLSGAHLVGALTFVVLVGVWLVPFYLATDLDAVLAVWSEGSWLSQRFTYHDPGLVVRHLLVFPLEIWACMLPWSALLPVLALRLPWQARDEARTSVTFLLLAAGVIFTSCWLPPGGATRHAMALYPCLAPVIGWVIQRSSEVAQVSWDLKRLNLWICTATMVVAAAAVLWASLTRLTPSIFPAQSFSVTAFYVLATLGLLALLHGSYPRSDGWYARASVLVAALFLGLTHTGIFLNLLIFHSADTPAAVARLKEQLPNDVRLVSFGTVHHRFAYLYQDPIALRPWPNAATDVAPDIDYFCYDEWGEPPRAIPFAWKPVAVISCDRYRRAVPRDRVVIGRRNVTGGTRDADRPAKAPLPAGCAPAGVASP